MLLISFTTAITQFLRAKYSILSFKLNRQNSPNTCKAYLLTYESLRKALNYFKRQIINKLLSKKH